jgi:acetyl-CoA carboxylase biotin carboxyl carrier protein
MSRAKSQPGIKRPNPSGPSSEVPEAVIRKLAEILKSTDLAEIEMKTEKLSVRVRGRESTAVVTAPSVVSAPVLTQSALQKKEEHTPDSGLHIVRSPFVGTFYRSPSPTSPSFVEQGQTVSKGQSLCIVEAMKLMNEIEADTSGSIEKIYVENGSPVEFNTALFAIRPL